MDSDSDSLFNIPGNVPNPVDMPNHCYFKERCAHCTKKCSGEYPKMIQVSPTHFVACHLYNNESRFGSILLNRAVQRRKEKEGV